MARCERDGLVEVAVAGHTIAVVGRAPAGSQALVGLRPEDLVLEPAAAGRLTSAGNRLGGTAVRLAPQGPVCRVVVDCGVSLTAVVTRPSVAQLGLAPGAPVTRSFKASAPHLVRPGPSRDRREPVARVGGRPGGAGRAAGLAPRGCP